MRLGPLEPGDGGGSKAFGESGTTVRETVKRARAWEGGARNRWTRGGTLRVGSEPTPVGMRADDDRVRSRGWETRGSALAGVCCVGWVAEKE